MADFSEKYTSANVAQDAAQYETELFLGLHDRLTKHLPSNELATALITVALCAQGRGDAVVRLFHDVTKESSDSELRIIFTAVREAITVVVPFVGLPNCMPACFGLVNELKGRGINDVSGPRRENLQNLDYFTHGEKTVTTIYRGVGNSEVREMTQQYFPEMSYYGRTTIFGYLVGSSPIFELRDTEILVAAAITSLGATRQARSHVKCSLQMGNSLEIVTAMVETAKNVAAWNRRPLWGPINVGELAEELEWNLSGK